MSTYDCYALSACGDNDLWTLLALPLFFAALILWHKWRERKDEKLLRDLNASNQ